MFISATVLYFGELPKGYDLYKTNEGFQLNAAPAENGDSAFATITVRQLDQTWQFETALEEDIQQQVIRLISLHEAINLKAPMSAAM